MKKTLVVMAAGMGSRFGGLKQIEPVGPNGEFIIDYSVYDAKRTGFEKVVFVIKKELEEAFKESIGKRLENKIDVAYVFQEINDIPAKKYLAEKREKPWGTIQAVLSAKDEVKGDFLVINADDFYGYDSYKKASLFLDDASENEAATINFPFYVTASKFGSVKRAVCFMDGDKITKLIECKVDMEGNEALAEPLNGDDAFMIDVNNPVAVNMFAFKNSFFKDVEKFFEEYFKQDDETILKSEALLPDLVKEKIMNKELVLKNIVSESLWRGMTYRDDLEELQASINELINKGEYPRKLWE